MSKDKNRVTGDGPNAASLQAAAEVVAAEFGFEVADLVAPGQTREVADARKCFFHLGREVVGAPWREVGDALERKHETAMSGARQHENIRATVAAYRQKSDRAEASLRQRLGLAAKGGTP